MNTYTQDKDMPIYITLSYDYFFLKFPVNPESIKKEIASTAITEDVEGIGQVSTTKKPNLARITIESFFWQDVNLVPSSMYVTWLERWQKSGKPATLIVTRLNYSMQVTCENFIHWINGGEETDIYFTLDLLEYRPHGAKKLGIVTNKKLLQKIKDDKELISNPILFDTPRPSRISSSKKTFSNPYTVLKNETLQTVTKKITGSTDDWKSLYDENKVEIGNILNDGSEIPSGTKLKLPDSWVNDSSYGIIQEVV